MPRGFIRTSIFLTLRFKLTMNSMISSKPIMKNSSSKHFSSKRRKKRLKRWSLLKTTITTNRSPISVPSVPISRVLYKTTLVKIPILRTRTAAPYSLASTLPSVVGTEVTVAVTVFTINPIMMKIIPDIFSLYY